MRSSSKGMHLETRWLVAVDSRITISLKSFSPQDMAYGRETYPTWGGQCIVRQPMTNPCIRPLRICKRWQQWPLPKATGTASKSSFLPYCISTNRPSVWCPASWYFEDNIMLWLNQGQSLPPRQCPSRIIVCIFFGSLLFELDLSHKKAFEWIGLHEIHTFVL